MKKLQLVNNFGNGDVGYGKNVNVRVSIYHAPVGGRFRIQLVGQRTGGGRVAAKDLHNAVAGGLERAAQNRCGISGSDDNDFHFYLYCMAVAQQLALTYVRTKFALLSLISKKSAAAKAFRLFCTPQYRNRKVLPPIFERAEKLQFRFLNYTVRGYRWNANQPKKALILHGFESSVINFDRYVKPLLAKGYQVLAFDAPAHGRSTGTTFNALLYKELIQTIYKTYGPVQSFIAHSFGGLALSLALEEIEHDAATKVVFIAPATETTTAVDSFFQYLKLDAALRPEFDNIIAQKSGHPPAWFSVARAARAIRASVLWVHDRDDTMTPLADVKPVQEAGYPNFRFLITEGLGHRRVYRDNKVSKAILEFL